MSEFQAHQQLVLRVFDDLAARLRQEMSAEGEIPPIELKRQEDMGPVYFQFIYMSEAFPALLMNMPCNLETHKTFDSITFFKSGDIGQMLQVFSDDESREEIHSQLKLIEGYNCYPSGLTPPTKNIIKRKFLKTRLHKERPHELVAEVEDEIENMKPTEDTIEIFEEVVDFEDWMVSSAQPDGISIALEDAEWGPVSAVLQQHPEILFKRKEVCDMEAVMQKTVKGTALRQASTSSGADVRIAEAETELVAAAGAVSSNMSSGIGEVEGSADLGVEEEEVLEEGGGAEVHSDCGDNDAAEDEDADGHQDWVNQMEEELDI